MWWPASSQARRCGSRRLCCFLNWPSTTRAACGGGSGAARVSGLRGRPHKQAPSGARAAHPSGARAAHPLPPALPGRAGSWACQCARAARGAGPSRARCRCGTRCAAWRLRAGRRTKGRMSAEHGACGWRGGSAPPLRTGARCRWRRGGLQTLSSSAAARQRTSPDGSSTALPLQARTRRGLVAVAVGAAAPQLGQGGDAALGLGSSQSVAHQGAQGQGAARGSGQGRPRVAARGAGVRCHGGHGRIEGLRGDVGVRGRVPGCGERWARLRLRAPCNTGAAGSLDGRPAMSAVSSRA